MIPYERHRRVLEKALQRSERFGRIVERLQPFYRRAKAEGLASIPIPARLFDAFQRNLIQSIRYIPSVPPTDTQTARTLWFRDVLVVRGLRSRHEVCG